MERGDIKALQAASALLKEYSMQAERELKVPLTYEREVLAQLNDIIDRTIREARL